MKRFLLFLSALAVLSCAKPQPQAFQVIPMPDQVTVNDGTFCVKGAAVHFDDDLDEASAAAVLRFVDAIETATGTQCKWAEGGMIFRANPSLAAEQYSINITPKSVTVEASALNGFVYACETLKQMLPAAIYGKEAVKAGVKAGDIIKSVTAICGGKGGGKPDSAMGGGTDLLKLDDALASVDDFVAVKLGL